MDFRPVPHGHTAQRLTFEYLPPHVRDLIGDRLGSPVTRADSQTSGFTPGFASVLTGEDGRAMFVKAASNKAQARFAAAYAEEARVAALFGDTIPAPRLLWTHDGGPEDWFVVAFEAVDGAPPSRPWQAVDLERCLDLASAMAESTRHLPAGLDLRPLSVDLPRLVSGWDYVAALNPDWPHRAEAAALAAEFDLLSTAFAHADLRDDNILLTTDGRALACDWNWPGLAPAAFDTAGLLLSAYGDGVDVDAVIAAHPFASTLDPHELDVTVAALTGFMLESRDQPHVPTSPHLRDHGNAWAEAGWAYLCHRQGWDA